MYRRRKLRSDETWAAVRRSWEAGETAALLARRYDVGLDNLWRRRASEGWERRRTADPDPEPIEGWNRYAERRMAEFELRREETRMLAAKLAEAMQGGPLDQTPLWHLGFVLAWREERLGPAVAERDRAWAGRYAWTSELWDEDGGLLPLWDLDAATLRANRDAWREDAGLPDGVAEDWP